MKNDSLPLVEFTAEDKHRFWSRVKKGDGCWIWMLGKDKDGYGKIKIKRRHLRAHRVAWEMVNDAIPIGLMVLHSCDNPSCVNPSHLFLGTSLDNMKDMMRKGRRSPQNGDTHYYRRMPHKITRGEKHGAAKISDRIASEIRSLYSRRSASQRAISRMFSISQTAVCKIVNMKTWTHILLT